MRMIVDMPIPIGRTQLHCRHQLPQIGNMPSHGTIRSIIHKRFFHNLSEQANTLISRNTLTRTLLIPSIQIRPSTHGSDTTGPRITQIPILVTEYGKVLISRGRIGNVADVEKDVFKVATTPVRIEVSCYCRCVDMVSVVEVMIVVEPISKIQARIIKCRTARKDIITLFLPAIEPTTAIN